MIWLGLAAGCDWRFEDDKPSSSGSTDSIETTPRPALVALTPPVGPTDPLIALLSDWTVSNEPVVLGPDGERVSLVPVDYPAPGAGPAHYGWVAVGGWAKGNYDIVQVGTLAVDMGFHVGKFGPRGGEALDLVGRAWKVTSAVSSSGLDSFALGEGDAFIVVESIDGDVAQFAALVAPEDEPCIVLRDVAAWDADAGHLEWAVNLLEVETKGSDPPIEIRDLWGEVWFAPDGTTAAGRAHADVDTRYVMANDEAFVCDIVSTFGVDCAACPDGEPYCRREDIDQIELVEVDRIDLSAANVCGFDRLAVGEANPEPIDCDFSIDLDPGCNCATPVGRQVALPLALAVLVGVGRRRRLS